jgi:hypothetical protein
MNYQEKIYALREAFEERVGKYSLEPWTISEEEAVEFMRLATIPMLLTVFSNTGRWITDQAKNLYFHPQEAVLAKIRFLIDREKTKKDFDLEKRKRTRAKEERSANGTA